MKNKENGLYEHDFHPSSEEISSIYPFGWCDDEKFIHNSFFFQKTRYSVWIERDTRFQNRIFFFVPEAFENFQDG